MLPRLPLASVAVKRCDCTASTLLGIGRCHPRGDLRARAEPELVEDAADVAVDGVFGDEQAGAYLLVAQAVGAEASHLGFPFGQRGGSPIFRCRRGAGGRGEREPDRGAAAHPASVLELRLERPWPQG